jgi:chemotaxis methyl-accepting protein methylase
MAQESKPMSETPAPDLFERLNRAAWKRLPRALRDSRAAYWYGSYLHRLLGARARRRQYFGTFFFRNRPELEQLRRVAALKREGATLSIAILGCSIGAEVYSVLWTIRSARPDLQVRVQAVDYAPEVLEVARRAVYTSDTCGLVGSSIFERLTAEERSQVFDWEGEQATVKPWLREGIQFRQGDAGDPGLVHALGPQDIVFASNFLCHMDSVTAEKCLRNIGTLIAPGGHLFVLGVDLDVRAKVARDLRWHPLPELIREMHDGDPSVRGDWPFEWWGLEPLNDSRRDWQLRYAVAYQVG